jgi:formylmethanofuran dehydrogenase subunit E
MTPDITTYLAQSSSRHSHLCPRQVLGVRMGLLALRWLGFDGPPAKKRFLVIAETDGCLVDGIEAVTGVSAGHRTLRIEDVGKVAAVFTDVVANRSLRLAPRLDVRERALRYAPEEPRHYFAQLCAYPIMPDDQLFSIQEVILTPSASVLVSRPGVRVDCARCGEEIINEREIYQDRQPFCRVCAGQSVYYRPVGEQETGVIDRLNVYEPNLISN